MKQLLSKISVDSNFAFTSYAWGRKKKNCLVVLHHPPIVFENWKKAFTVQKYTAPNFQNSIFFFFENVDLSKIFLTYVVFNFQVYWF